jgi:hypothetical protein
MPLSLDVTNRKSWRDEHVDRLLGFECLKQVCTGNPNPIHPYVLAEKIGRGRGFPSALIKRVYKQHAKRTD